MLANAVRIIIPRSCEKVCLEILKAAALAIFQKQRLFSRSFQFAVGGELKSGGNDKILTEEVSMRQFCLDKKDVSIYLKLFALELLYVFPIILADMYYNDDLARSLCGATGWKGDGRPLGEYLMVFLSGGEPIADLAPLPLILAMLILAYALTIYAKCKGV